MNSLNKELNSVALSFVLNVSLYYPPNY